MNKRVALVILGLLKSINPYTSLIMGFLTATWGIWLLMPWHVFNSAKMFNKILEFAPEYVWGGIALTAGTMVTVSVFKGSFRWLVISLALTSWHWGATSVFMWWGDWQNTGGVTYTFLCIYSVYAQMNIKINYVNQGYEHFHFRTDV